MTSAAEWQRSAPRKPRPGATKHAPISPRSWRASAALRWRPVAAASTTSRTSSSPQTASVWHGSRQTAVPVRARLLQCTSRKFSEATRQEKRRQERRCGRGWKSRRVRRRRPHVSAEIPVERLTRPAPQFSQQLTVASENQRIVFSPRRRGRQRRHRDNKRWSRKASPLRPAPNRPKGSAGGGIMPQGTTWPSEAPRRRDGLAARIGQASFLAAVHAQGLETRGLKQVRGSKRRRLLNGGPSRLRFLRFA
mmetsp:Transcript_51568/g.144085  ORF Transcript_51568/g.144085 Transcript_51568/m.144085 type:complete len:250 (-) Transcript_51568:64-813(-)